MRKYTSLRRRFNLKLLTDLVEGAEGRAQNRAHVLLKTDATNELQVKYSWQPFDAKQKARKSIADAESAARSDALVYSAKPQADSSEVPASRSRGRGRKLTPYGGHTIREACAVLERDYGRKVGFITLTLPGSTSEAMEALAENSREIQNAFTQRIRDLWRRHFTVAEKCTFIDEGRKPPELDYAFVWEYQTRGALHIHLAIGVERAEHYKALKGLHKRFWIDTLEHYSDLLGVDLFARASGGTWRGKPWKVKTECNRVKKSVGRYMSKYVSKGAREAGADAFAPPRRWWSVSKNLKDKVVADRQILSAGAECPEMGLQTFLKLAQVASGFAETVYAVKNEYTGEVRRYLFYVSDEEKSGLIDLLLDLVSGEDNFSTLNGIPWQTAGPPDANGEVYQPTVFPDMLHAHCEHSWLSK